MKESYDASLIRSIANESLSDLLGDIAEISIDSIIETETLRDIPIIGLLFGLLKTGGDIRTTLFIRKIAIFLKQLSTISKVDRQEFINKLDDDRKKHEFGQTILLLLDRADDMKKPLLIAKIMNAYILGKVEENRAMRLCAIISRCYTQDLELLKHFKNGVQGKSEVIAEALFSIGLLSNGGFDGGTFEDNRAGTIYNLNEYGELLKQFAIDQN